MKQILISGELCDCLPAEPEGRTRLEMAALLEFCERFAISPKEYWMHRGAFIVETDRGQIVDYPDDNQLYTTIPVADLGSYQALHKNGTRYMVYLGGHYTQMRHAFIEREKALTKALVGEKRAGYVIPEPPGKRFQDLHALAEMFQIPIHSYEVWGSCEVALVDVHPDWRGGTPGKYKHVIQHGTSFVADFAIGELRDIPRRKRFDDFASIFEPAPA